MFLTIIPICLISFVQFYGQKKKTIFSKASNYWILFYLLAYFSPIINFFDGTHPWYTAWNYPFRSFEMSLIHSTLIAFLGGLVMSLTVRYKVPGDKRGTKDTRQYDANMFGNYHRTSYVRISLISLLVIISVTIGVYLAGGLIYFLGNLYNRVILTEGLNVFFLPINIMIGVTFTMLWTRQKILFLSTLLLTVLLLILAGQKANYFILAVGLLFIYASRSEIKLYVIAPYLFLVTNALFFYEIYFRHYIVQGYGFDDLTLLGWLKKVSEQVSGNFLGIQNLTVMVDSSVPVLWGKTYLDMFQIIIPQSIYPGIKPLTSAGVFTQEFYSSRYLNDPTTMPPGLFGEAYLNFGVFGFILACFCVGYILRYVDKLAQRSNFINNKKILYVATIASTSFHFIRGELFSPMILTLGVLIGLELSLSHKRPALGR